MTLPTVLSAQQPDSSRDTTRVIRGGTLSAIVVTAARREQRLKDVVVATELVSRRDIARAASPDVAGVLTQQTGITLDGGVPAGSGVSLQGLGSQRVLVLLDGQPLIGRVNGNLDLSRVPASMVERIEVVKGPQSTLYGSDALGGVVNIITRRPPDGGLRFAGSLVGGTQARRDGDIAIAGSNGALGWTLDAGMRQNDLAPGRPADASTRTTRWNAAPALVWRSRAGVELTAGALFLGERQRYGTGQLFHFADNAQLNARAGAAVARGTSRLGAVVALSRFDHLSRTATTPQPASDSGARDLQDLLQGEVTWSGIAGTALLDLGLVARHEAINAERVPGRRTTGSLEPFAQATWERGPVTVTPGLRLSWNEQWGTAVTPRVAALWRPAARVALRGSLGRGYRAPDFKELYLSFANSSFGYAVEGNPNLAPETSTNLSGGVEYTAGAGSLRLTLFGNWYQDFIVTVGPDASGTYSYANIDQGSTRGAEAEAGVTLARVRLAGGAAWLRARDDATGRRLPGRPAWSAHVSLGMTVVAGVELTAVGLYTGRVPVDGSATPGERPAFPRLNLRAAAPLPGHTELTLAVDNVFDRRLGPLWPGFTGRSAALGIAWRPGEER